MNVAYKKITLPRGKALSLTYILLIYSYRGLHESVFPEKKQKMNHMITPAPFL